ncbi:MAG: PAS domain-containing protein [Acidobacteria bacterium]|nr:PAS domain-containing protein [Acidobacteriota bacterium]
MSCRHSLRGRLILAGLLIECVIVINALLLILAHHWAPGITLLLAALAGAIVTLHTDRRLRGNVVKLIEATSHIPDDAGELKTEIDTGDQLEILGKRFNAMAEAIRLRQTENLRMQAQLNQQALRLESEVASRTRELAEEGAKLNAMINAIPAGLIILDSNHRILWANRVVEQWRHPLPQMLGGTCHETIWADRHRCRDCPTERALQTGKVEASEKSASDDNGEKKYFQIISSPMRNPQGSVTGVVELVQDVTHSKKLQAHLVQTGKMAAIGQLAAGVAHEINNPMGIILGKADLMLSSYASILPQKAISDLQTIQRHSHRITGITRGLLQLSRRGRGDWRQVNLNELVRETLPLVEHQFLSGRSRLKLSLQPELPPISGDPGQLQEVLVNLVQNAMDAMRQDGGEVEIATRCRSSPGKDRENGSVALLVRDAGIGIPGTIRNRIFDPFFTTKPVGKGTGLGLSIVSGIIRDHGGEIRVESETGKGTTFEIIFPHKFSAAAADPG